MRPPRTVLASLLTATLAGPLLAGPLFAGPATAAVAAQAAATATATARAAATATARAAATDRQLDYRQWDTAAQLSSGKLSGLRVARGRLRISGPVGKATYPDANGRRTSYAYGRWTSPWHQPGFGFTELIPSWNATSRGDAWIKVQVRGRGEDGRRSSWDTLARWAPGDTTIHRTSLGEQPDDLARVAVDTWKSNYSLDLTAWQVRLTLYRKAGTHGTPFVDTVGAVASKLPSVDRVPTSRPLRSRAVALEVPKYSQMTHRGEYPQYGNGGEAWCSPTSTTMVLGYLDRLPERSEYSWVDPNDRNRYVDHAARMTYDYAYRGTGNWPFNTAYAGNHADHAFVTRLRDLRQAERFVGAGIPVVASIAFGAGELRGAPITSTNGHLVVIVGFTDTGDVVVNDPAAARNKGVRRTYDRGEFENAWLPTSGGLAYIIRNDEQPLPARHGATNW